MSRRPERRAHDPEARLLAFHVTAGLQGARGLVDAEPGEQRIARLLGPHRQREHGRKHHDHRGQQGPALARVADHTPEGVAEGRRDQQDGQQLQKIRERRRILERVRGARVEEPAAVGAELLDRDLRRDRPDRQHLFLLRHLQRERMATRIFHPIAGGIGPRHLVGCGFQQRHGRIG
jgi:hypothetical protein